MNSGFLITDAGLAAAAVATPTGPYIHITSFEIGSAFGYNPQRNQTSLQGTILYTGVASSYTVVDGDTVEIGLRMDATVGSFTFGEIGLRLVSGELFAILVFENPQEKVRAVGNQAGNTWYIRARIKLAQAPAIVQVTLINSQSILEVPNWQSLQKPGDQIMGANIAIVHANNSSDDPVLVIRDNDDEWGLVDYSRSFLGSTTDPGAVLGTTTFIHPDIANLYFKGMPRSDSRYLVKFPDGSIRQITSNPSPTQIGFTPSVSTAQSGPISIWEEGGLPTTFASSSSPPGMVAYFARNTAPVGWLKCNGAAVSRTAYAALFASIGTTFGAGDGSTTFNVPDLRGEFIRGWDDGRGVDPGRELGSWQRASRVLTDWFSYNTGRDAIANGGLHTAAADMEAGSIVETYAATETKWVGSSYGTHTAATWGGRVRPRNVALLACIKY